MDDKELIRLYQARDERAITESEQKYGSFLRRIALNLLGSPEDAEECVNDALLAAWNRIPPHEPVSLKAFLSKLIRDIAISRFRESHAAKRGNGTLTEVLDDLAETIPSSFSVDEEVEANALSALIEAHRNAMSGSSSSDAIIMASPSSPWPRPAAAASRKWRRSCCACAEA